MSPLHQTLNQTIVLVAWALMTFVSLASVVPRNTHLTLLLPPLGFFPFGMCPPPTSAQELIYWVLLQIAHYWCWVKKGEWWTGNILVFLGLRIYSLGYPDQACLLQRINLQKEISCVWKRLYREFPRSVHSDVVNLSLSVENISFCLVNYLYLIFFKIKI